MPPTKESDFEKDDHVKKCPICSKSFGLTLWRHHCHWCGDVVCDNCSQTRHPLPPMYPEAVRVCDLCKNEAAGQAAKSAPRKLGTASTTAVSSGGTLGTNNTQGATSGTYEEERAKRAAAVEARMKANSKPSQSSAANTTKDPEDLEKQRQRELRQRIMERDMAAQQRERKEKEQRQLEEALAASKAQQLPLSQQSGESEIPPAATEDNDNAAPEVPSDAPKTEGTASSPQSGSNPMLEAALRRQAASAAKGGKAPAPTTVDPERAQLLSRITQILAAQRKEEPFGLRSMDASKLRMYLRHLEGE